MRLLILAPIYSSRGPIPKHTPWLVEALEKLGCEIELASWGAKRGERNLIQRAVGRKEDIKNVLCKVRDNQYDIVILKTAHDWVSLTRDLAFIMAVKPYSINLIIQFHGSWTKTYSPLGNKIFKWLTQKLIDNIQGGLVLSNEELCIWQSMAKNIPFFKVKNPYRVPYHGFVTLIEKREEQQPLRILYSGRLIKEKGIFELLSAFNIIHKEYDCVLQIVGDGRDACNFQRQISKLRIEKKVELRGWLEGEPLKRAYQEADVFVLPSWSEGFPFVIYEAMEAGLPIITTNIRGMKDELEHEGNALLIPPRDEEQLAKSLHILLSNPDMRIEMGRKNRQKLKEYEPIIVAKEYLNILSNIKKGYS